MRLFIQFQPDLAGSLTRVHARRVDVHLVQDRDRAGLIHLNLQTPITATAPGRPDQPAKRDQPLCAQQPRAACRKQPSWLRPGLWYELYFVSNSFNKSVSSFFLFCFVFTRKIESHHASPSLLAKQLYSLPVRRVIIMSGIPDLSYLT